MAGKNNANIGFEKQIKCIDKSLKIFSDKDMEEALRIATSLGVLLHNTQNSTFLFH